MRLDTGTERIEEGVRGMRGRGGEGRSAGMTGSKFPNTGDI